MAIISRFGKRLALSPTAQILNELRLMAAADAIRAHGPLSVEQTEIMAKGIATANGLTVDRVRMLVERFDLARAGSETQPARARAF